MTAAGSATGLASVDGASATGRRGALSTLEFGLAMVLLTVGAVTSCVVAAAWLTLYVGPVPVPVTVLAAGAWTLLLVRVAAMWSERLIVAAFPAIVWILTLVAINLGPGGNMPVPIGLRGLGLLVVGGLLPLWAAFFGRSAAHAHRR